MDQKSLTLRVPMDLYAQIAAGKRKSITRFIIQAVEEKLAKEREEQLRIGFASLAGSVDPAEIEPWLAAQRKAMERIDA